MVDERREQPAGRPERLQCPGEHVWSSPNEHEGVERVGDRPVDGRRADVADLESHRPSHARLLGSVSGLVYCAMRGIDADNPAAGTSMDGNRDLAAAAPKVHDNVVGRWPQGAREGCNVIGRGVAVNGRSVDVARRYQELLAGWSPEHPIAHGEIAVDHGPRHPSCDRPTGCTDPSHRRPAVRWRTAAHRLGPKGCRTTARSRRTLRLYP